MQVPDRTLILLKHLISQNSSKYISAMDMKDVDLYVRTGTFRPKASFSVKRIIRRKAKAFLISPNGKLVYRGRGGEGDTDAHSNSANLREVVFTKKEQERIIASLHSGPGGHYGRNRTREKVLSKYYWHPMTLDIDRYVKECKVCQDPGRKIIRSRPAISKVCDQKQKVVQTLDMEAQPRLEGLAPETEVSMEVCVDSVESAVNAFNGGASRVELCAGLFEGGTTPSLGLLQVIKRQCPMLPVFVLIRPRGGDFIYSPLEFEVMMQDIKTMMNNGADGFVFGILTSDGDVDKDRCQELLNLCQPLPATFHRAFDMCRDPFDALEDIISLGFQRLLTSGQDSSVLEGLPLIAELVERSGDRISVMPGGGITERNLQRVLDGCHVREFHCSARCTQESLATHRNSAVAMGAALRPPEFTMKYADEDLVRRLGAIQSKR